MSNGLLNLYDKEKEKNKELEYGLYETRESYNLKKRELELNLQNFNEMYIAKDKIKWKPISEYDREKYDWVLVKYFDGDFECIPEVAEKRVDGKWYTSEKEIPFEVKYFFDMQELLED